MFIFMFNKNNLFIKRNLKITNCFKLVNNVRNRFKSVNNVKAL
jgi:hypothetical protein